MLELVPPELWWLVVIAFIAGLVDAAVGGGGLVQLPGLFTVLPQQTPAMLFGTNKFSSMFGTGAAAWRYARNVRFPWKPVLFAAGTAFIFSFAGATAVSLLPKDAVRPLVLVLLVAMLAYTLWKKDFGALHRPQEIGRRELVIALAIGAAIGFYDGFFGPGTGSFLIFLFVRCYAWDFLRASAAAKVVNVSTNLAALAWFVPVGAIMAKVAAAMAVANLAGAWVGAHLAIKNGASFVRRPHGGHDGILRKLHFAALEQLLQRRLGIHGCAEAVGVGHERVDQAQHERRGDVGFPVRQCFARRAENQVEIAGQLERAFIS